MTGLFQREAIKPPWCFLLLMEPFAKLNAHRSFTVWLTDETCQCLLCLCVTAPPPPCVNKHGASIGMTDKGKSVARKSTDCNSKDGRSWMIASAELTQKAFHSWAGARLMLHPFLFPTDLSHPYTLLSLCPDWWLVQNLKSVYRCHLSLECERLSF